MSDALASTRAESLGRIDHDLFAFDQAIENFLQVVGRVPDLNGPTFQTVSSLDVADGSGRPRASRPWKGR